MRYEAFHVFEYAQCERLFHGWKVIEEFRERPAMFQVIEQCSNRHARADEDRRAPENLRIRMDAGNLIVHD